MQWCQTRGVLYIDTVAEPWPGGYTDPALTASQRSNYAQREKIVALKKLHPEGPTSISCHGANPGLVSHFVKQALLNIARDTGVLCDVPVSQKDWAQLAQSLGVKTIHIAERDSQVEISRSWALICSHRLSFRARS
jgi:homospermidine synthase